MHFSKFRCGSTGCGKTVNQMVDSLAIAKENDCAQIILDSKGTMARTMVGHFVAAGLERRVIYDELASTDGKVLAWDFLPLSASTDPFQRRLELEIIREEFKQLLLARKGLQTDDDKGFTREVLDLAIDVMQQQNPRKPLPIIRRCFDPMSTEFQQLINDCTDQGVRRRLQDSARLFHRSPTQYEIWVGSARRMLDVVDTAAVQTRCRPAPGINWEEELRQKKLIVINGAGVPRASTRFVFLSVGLQVTNACRRFHARTRRPLPSVLVLEEAGANNLCAPFILTGLQEGRESGFSAHVLTQSTMDFEKAVTDKILQNTPGGHYWAKLLSAEDQEKAADDLANATFDAMAVHYTRTKQVHDGVQEIHHKVRGESTDHNDNTRKDTRDAVNFLPRFRQEIEEVYKTPQLHQQEYKTAVANLRVGEFYLRTMEGVHKIKGKMLGEPWPFGITESRTAQALARIRSQPLYQPARLIEPPPPPPPPSPPPTGAPSPQAIAAVHATSTANLRRRAMRNSRNT